MVLVHCPRTNNVLAMYWVSTSPLAPSVRQVVLPLHATVVHGKLSSPLLRQGMFFIQDRSVIFVAEELGHCPTRDDYLVVIAIRFDNNDPQQYSTFPLYLPIKIVEPSHYWWSRCSVKTVITASNGCYEGSENGLGGVFIQLTENQLVVAWKPSYHIWVAYLGWPVMRFPKRTI